MLASVKKKKSVNAALKEKWCYILMVSVQRNERLLTFNLLMKTFVLTRT